METMIHQITIPRLPHSWLRRIRLAYVPGPTTPLLNEVSRNLLDHFKQQGHIVLPKPQGGVDVLLTTAAFGEPTNWREAMLFTARRRYHLSHAPQVFTLLHATPGQLQELFAHFEKALAKNPPEPGDFAFPGLTEHAFHTLYEQGRRGGPILSVIRLVQSQAMSIRAILVVGERRPNEAYTFDLVGAHPRSDASDPDAFYDDLVYRILTAASTHEVTDHEVVDQPVPQAVWQSLSTPTAMRTAGLELGKRHFFTEMVRVANLVSVPALHEAVSSQYSEGCFATWDPQLQGLVATVTGSARPVAKDKLSDDELAIIVGIRPDGKGAQVRHVDGLRNDPPSSEAVEMLEMDERLPRIKLDEAWKIPAEVPVARSKLHGHRGVKTFDPRWVEHVSLDAPYYHYPVSCSTEAQARAIRSAFSRSVALQNPGDPRQVIFTVLPGHGIVIAEKWVAGKAPFQIMWEFMDQGRLVIDNLVPQGPLAFFPDEHGMQLLQAA